MLTRWSYMHYRSATSGHRVQVIRSSGGAIFINFQIHNCVKLKVAIRCDTDS